MQSISFNDPGWQTTFPHIVMPLQNEWLPGLFLRCDEANSWHTGTTFVLGGGHAWKFIVAPISSYLEPLSRFLAIPRELILATTYHIELARLYETHKPAAKYLPKDGPSRFCPQCIAETRLLPRTLLFPQVDCCPHHGLELCSCCSCGEFVTIFPFHSQPFTCDTCRLPWECFPQKTVTQKQINQAQRYFRYYQFFLDEGTKELIDFALTLVYERWLMTNEMKWFAGIPDHERYYTRETVLETTPLPILISALIAFNIALSDIKKAQSTLAPRFSHWKKRFMLLLREIHAQTTPYGIWASR